ncbi:MAG: hypothetical protein MUE47_08320 [Acidobacteria bacterium]|nr:hypothetical protein [Acidobacteriota bacterium]
MTTTQRAALWTAALVAGVSGLAYAGMKYLLPRTDPFSAYGHPLQPHALRLHVLAVPVLIFVVGWVYGAHAQYQLRQGEPRGRASGRGILGLTLVLALSGYLVQAFADAAWRPGAAWVHGLSGVVFVTALAGHALAGRRGRAVSRSGDRSGERSGERAAPAVGDRSGDRHAPAAGGPRRPGYLRPITFPRPAGAAPGPLPDSPPGGPAGACGGCTGCGIAPGVRASAAREAAGRTSLSRANRD